MSQTKAQLIDPVDGTIVNADINASAAIDGTKISPSFTSNLTITNTQPKIFLTDSNNASDFSIQNENGNFNIFDESNSVSRVRIVADGKVGIGTTSPVNTLHVNSGATNTAALFESSDTEVGIQLKDTTGSSVIKARNDFRFDNSTGELMRIDSSGRLLLGTTTEGEGTADDFTIANSSHAGMTIRSGTTAECNIFFADGTSGNARFRGMVRYFHSSDALAFNTSAVERMRIDAGGGVQLGTTTATASKLTVYGANDAATIFQGSNTGTGAGNGFITGNNGDVNAFVWNYENGFMQFGTNNIERIRIANDGKIGIGNSNPINFVDIHRGADEENILIVRGQDTSGEYCALGVNGSNAIVTAGGVTGNNTNLVFRTAPNGNETERMRITSSGSVGIGTTSPNQKLSISGASGQDCYFETNTQVNGGLVLNVVGTQRGIFANDSAFSGGSTDIGIGAKGNMIFRVGSTSYTERMRIDTAGRLMMGTTTVRNLSTLTVKGDNQAPLSCEASASTGFSQIFFVNPNGNVGQINTLNSETRYFTTSDYRLKENIIDLTGAITRLKTLQPKRFNWISDETNTLQDGFLAHEVTAVPEAITGTKDEVDSDNNPLYQMIDNSKIVPLLVAALKELTARVETLEAA